LLSSTPPARQHFLTGSYIDEITQAGGRTAACPGDVTDERSALELVQFAVERFASLDIFAANAGIVSFERFSI
jgi:NAD(P)-dependent dehydrogenase (short-subunit alcohol dehydrogenase family)